MVRQDTGETLEEITGPLALLRGPGLSCRYLLYFFGRHNIHGSACQVMADHPGRQMCCLVFTDFQTPFIKHCGLLAMDGFEMGPGLDPTVYDGATYMFHGQHFIVSSLCLKTKGMPFLQIKQAFTLPIGYHFKLQCAFPVLLFLVL